MYNECEDGGEEMKYSIEIGKIVEGALKRDYSKVSNYTQKLIDCLREDGEERAASKFSKLLQGINESTLIAMGFGTDSLPVDSESRTVLADVILPTETDEKVVLTEGNRQKIEAFIDGFKHADKLHEIGIEAANTLLLYGPPGCGKTKCAYLVAKELGLPLVVARLDSLISSYLGTTAKNIRMLFEYVQKTPCVLFLDEFDAIAKARDDSNELGELKRVVNSLLQNVDSMEKESVLIAATNHESLLDTAVWRRFGCKVEIEYPDEKAIGEMISLFTKDRIVLSEKEISELSILFEGLNGAAIEEIIISAVRKCVIQEVECDVIKIYDEFFIYKNIIPQNASDKEKTEIVAKFLRGKNSKIFSLQVIADICKCSKSTISKLLKE